MHVNTIGYLYVEHVSMYLLHVEHVSMQQLRRLLCLVVYYVCKSLTLHQHRNDHVVK